MEHTRKAAPFEGTGWAPTPDAVLQSAGVGDTPERADTGAVGSPERRPPQRHYRPGGELETSKNGLLCVRRPAAVFKELHVIRAVEKSWTLDGRHVS